MRNCEKIDKFYIGKTTRYMKSDVIQFNFITFFMVTFLEVKIMYNKIF